jgi:phosphomannomutase
MVTASHLPIDRNGFKFFSKVGGFFRKKDIQALVADATQVLQKMDQNRLEIRHGVVDKVRNFVLFLHPRIGKRWGCYYLLADSANNVWHR